MYVVPFNERRPTLRTPWCVHMLIALNVAVHWATSFLMDPRDAAFRYGFIAARSEALTWLSHMFLHGSPLHILGNLIFFWMFGREVEDALGRLVFPVAYLASGLAAVGLFRGLYPATTSPLIGASGAISGVLGLFVVLFPRAETRLGIGFHSAIITFKTRAVWAAVAWLGYQVLMDLLHQAGLTASSVAFSAHVGGLLGGALIGVFLVGLGYRERYERNRALHAPLDAAAGAQAAPSRLRRWSQHRSVRWLIPLLVLAMLFLDTAITSRFGAWTTPLVVANGSWGGRSGVEHPGWTGYTNADRVTGLALDRDGNLWSVGSGGAVCWQGAGATCTKYTTAEGLPSNDVRCVAAGADGSVWLGTSRGLARFDGATWHAYTIRDGLAGDLVHTLALAPDGSLWVGSDGGASHFDGQTWTNYDAKKNQVPGYIMSSAVASDGTVRFGGWDGFVRFDGANWSWQAVGTTGSLTRGPDGVLWRGGGDGGVWRFDGKAWRNYAAHDGPIDDWVRSIAVAPDGTLWAAGSVGIYAFDGHRWASLPYEEGPIRDPANAVVVGPDGAVWFGSESQGLFCFRSSEWRYHLYDPACWTQYLTGGGPASNDVAAIAVAPGGAVWLGTGEGVSRLDGKGWSSYSIKDELFSQRVGSLAMAPDGVLWGVTQPYGAARFDGKRWGKYRSPGGEAYGMYEGPCAIGPDGAVWIANSGRGVTRLDGRESRTFTTADGLAGNGVTAIAVGRDGALWFGTWDDGVSRYDGKGWVSYRPQVIPAIEYVHAIGAAPDGVLWFGAEDGAFRFDGRNWTTFTAAEGLADKRVQAIAVAQDAAIWFGTRKGASRFDGTTWTTYTTADGLMDDNVQAIAVAPDGAVWFGTSGGISRFEGAQ